MKAVGIMSAVGWGMIPAQTAIEELLSKCCSELELRQQHSRFNSSDARRVAATSQGTIFSLQCVLITYCFGARQTAAGLSASVKQCVVELLQCDVGAIYLLMCPHYALTSLAEWLKRESAWFELED